MYKIKDEVYKKYKKYGNTKKIAQQAGYNPDYISEILHGKIFKRKLLAYIIAKTLSSDLEIEDVFKIF